MDALRFAMAFQAPISTSAPHLYISALSFTPEKSSLWKNVRRSFPRLMKVKKGRMEAWPARPSVWQGHIEGVNGVAYSPDGRHVVSGSWDNTIRIWDAETGAAVGEPMKGHTGGVRSVAYSSDGRHVVSGSDDNTIRIWDAETRAAVGEPMKGHTGGVQSVAYSPDGRHIISGSLDNTIRIWDAGAPSSGIHLLPDSEGWICYKGNLILWVPSDCRIGLTCSAVMAIPITGHHRVVQLDLSNFKFGTAWTDVR